MSYYKGKDFIKNGDFSIIGSDPNEPFVHWGSHREYINQTVGYIYVASQEYDEDAQDTYCKISITGNYVAEADNIPGVYQYFEVKRVPSYDTTFQLEFDAKRLKGHNYITVMFAKTPDYTDPEFYAPEIKFIRISDSWGKCSCKLTLHGPGEYYLKFSSGVLNDGSYGPQEFLINNVKSNAEKYASPYMNIVQGGDFDSYNIPETYWDITCPSGYVDITEDKNDGHNHCELYTKDYIQLSQKLNIPDFINFGFDPYYDEYFNPDLKYNGVDVVIKAKCNTGSKLRVNLEKSYWSESGTGFSTSAVNEDYESSNKILTFTATDLFENRGEGEYSLSLSLALAASYIDGISTRSYFATIDSIEVNLFNPNIQISEDKGTLENPYTDEDGRIIYLEYRSQFKFYTGALPSKESFVLIDGQYYLVDSYGMYSEGFYTVGKNSYYVFPNGRIAFDEKFIYEDKVYQADKNGAYTYLCDKLSYINIKFNGNVVNSRVIGVPIGPIRLDLEFPEQYSEVTLTAETSKKDSVAKTINITSGVKSNVANIITEYGQESLTFSYINVDGTKTEACVFLHVVDSGHEYDEEISLDILSDVHYVELEKSLAISYIIRPNLAVTVDIDWLSSDESVAIVDVFGNIKPMGLGTCTITAINYATNISDTCTLHVVEETNAAASIGLSQTEVNIGISDSVFVKATVFNKNNSTINTNQEVKWESEKNTIATVDNGNIIGTGSGTTHIYCYSYDDRTIKNTVTVNVSGEVTAIKEIELNMYETMLDYNNPTKYEYIEWMFIPRNTNQTEVILTSSDPDTVQVARNGRLSIGDSPQLDTPIAIKCTSVSNPEIYRECFVTVVDKNYLPTITLGEKSIRTYVGKKIDIEYDISAGYYLHEATIKEVNGANSNNTAIILDDVIRVTANEAGDFILTISYYSNHGTSSSTCELKIYEADEEPQYAENLDLLYAFQDGSYILRYFAIDSDDDLNITHYINIDNDDYYSAAKPELLLYNNDEYHYIFGDGLKVGDHTIKIKIVDSQGLETISNEVSLVISDKSNRKETLEKSKDDYNEIKIDLINCLNDIIEDGKMSINDKREFVTRYKMFNVGYENLLNILDYCVKYINSQIETSQVEMATLADSLDSGVAIATYSEGDYTNSNFETVSDLDYYQSECIKLLAKKVLALEAIVQELQSKL